VGREQYQTDSDSGLLLLGHRYYDPYTGRFISQDPIADGNNWYAYVENNPLTGIDPDGLQKKRVDKREKDVQKPPWYKPFPTVEQAAIAALDYLQPISQRIGREMGGYIVETTVPAPGGVGRPIQKFTPEPPIIGERRGLPNWGTDLVPPVKRVGWIHTHPSDTFIGGNYDTRGYFRPSEGDMLISKDYGPRRGVPLPGYISTPGGIIGFTPGRVWPVVARPNWP
jgi:RHS repeat-associated protein